MSELEALLDRTNSEPDRDWVVGALIRDGRGRLYVQRRTLIRKLFPGCWDVVGGHLETGETVLEALRREIHEETGWTLKRVEALLSELDWNAEDPSGTRLKHEFDFMVEVEGDLERPVLEAGKHDAFLWISRNKLDVLRENRQSGDAFIVDLVERGFAYLEQHR